MDMDMEHGTWWTYGHGHGMHIACTRHAHGMRTSCAWHAHGMPMPTHIFSRWKERHVVHFNFCKRKQKLEPELEYPPSYSVAVQDHPSRGHPGRSWLFPCSEPTGNKEGRAREWLLVRPAEAQAEGVAVVKETAAAAATG